jgi:hypothetical protein
VKSRELRRVIAKCVVPFAAAALLGLALIAASCGPTCGTLQGCPSAGSGDAGASSVGSSTGADSGTACSALTAQRACLTSFCQTASNPFCTCYGRGYDLGPSCTCTPITDAQSASFCQDAAAQGIDASNFDCSAQTSSVSSQCVGVQ